jgi:ABC-2 type transport system permease protein
MKTYWALFKTELQQHLQYRISALAGAVTNIAFGFFRLFLLTAFYGASQVKQPMELPDLYSYIWFGQVLFGVMPITGMIGGDAEEIRTGAVAYRLTRPVSLYGFYFARVVGQKVTALCSRSLIQVILLFALLPVLGLSRYGMGAPNWGYFPLLLLSMVLTVFLSSAINAFVSMTGFWTISTRGSAGLAYAVICLFSGLLVPLAFFPPALRAAADILPFRGVYDTPARLYSGTMGLAQAVGGLGHQALWLVILLALGVLLSRRGAAKLEVAGG